MDCEELYGYKNRLMEEMCKNPEIVRLVTGRDDPQMPAFDLPYTNIFPFERVPDTADDAKTFVCFDIDIDSVPTKTTYFLTLYIWVFTHESKLRLPRGQGVLIDQMVAAIVRMLNGSRVYGQGELKLASVKGFVPVESYLGRMVAFKTSDFNLGEKKPVPVNRKAGL